VREFLVAGSVVMWLTAASGVTFTVTNTADSGPGSLRVALQAAITSTPPTRITFAISGSAPFVITPATPLPGLYGSTTVDGSTQSGFQLNSPAVVLDGLGADLIGLMVFGNNNLIRGLGIQHFNMPGVYLVDGSNRVEACVIVSNGQAGVYASGCPTVGGLIESNRNVISGNMGYGIQVEVASNALIACNWIGVHPTNSAQRMANVSAGVIIWNCISNQILGTAETPQVISGNGAYGLYIEGGGYSTIAGNHIGCDAPGTTAVSNTLNGVHILNSSYNTIGGTNYTQRNVLSGNGRAGVCIQESLSHHNVIQGNYVGVAVFGQPALPNRNRGIVLQFGASENLIGGGQPGAGNVVSGNNFDGISVSGYSNVIQGNIVGLDSTGSSIVSNSNDGIAISGGWNLVGGTQTVERNIICGNNNNGIQLNGGPSNWIAGNLIGVNADGYVRRNIYGISLNYSSNNLIGGTTTNARNVISGNNMHGIYVQSLARGEKIQGNYIGTTANGAGILGNVVDGIRIMGATNVLIGGGEAGAGNLISGNNSGIEIYSEARGVVIEGNIIGLAADGLSRLSTMQYGILSYCGGNRIGGTNTAERNVIAGVVNGIFLNQTTGMVVQGNYIGLAADGRTVVTNTMYTLNIYGGASNTIGGTVAGARNVLLGSRSEPTIYLSHQSDHNLIAGNCINYYPSGTNVYTNVAAGIEVENSSYNQIGGPDSSYRNYLSGGPANHALYLDGTGTQFNVIQENWFGLSRRDALITNAPGSFVSLNGAKYNTIRSNAFGTAQNVVMIGLSSTSTVGNVFQGNRFGVKEDGLTPLLAGNNEGKAFYVYSGSSNVIGGTDFADGNVIAYGHGAISIIGTNSGNAILGNRIYSNTTTSILIDLGNIGLTPNDPAPDPDIGANTLQNFPVLTNAAAMPGCVRVQGYLVSTPSRGYRLEFFQCDTFFPEAKWFLGYTNLMLGTSGTGTFSVVLNGNAPTGQCVTATATDPMGNTSEFSSPAFTVTKATDTDQDGMPDFWETQYGLNPAVSNGPSSDVDDDGVYDFGEYMSGTHPTNGTSVLEIVDIGLTDARQVTFPSSPYRLYDLQVAGSLLPGATWTTFVDNVIGHGGMETISDWAQRSNTLYRVRCHLP
jgi:hypothetical protein